MRVQSGGLPDRSPVREPGLAIADGRFFGSGGFLRLPAQLRGQVRPRERVSQRFERERVWRTVPDPEAVAAFRVAHGADLERLCRVIASSEARIYDRRARTLKVSHPLGIQVNLATGVANGVLVVRTIPHCAELLRRVVTNALEFDLREAPTMWYLEERISGCVYRVVSKDRKLTNCFWNFYRRAQA